MLYFPNGAKNMGKLGKDFRLATGELSSLLLNILAPTKTISSGE
jgi:hypothetical protein